MPNGDSARIEEMVARIDDMQASIHVLRRDCDGLREQNAALLEENNELWKLTETVRKWHGSWTVATAMSKATAIERNALWEMIRLLSDAANKICLPKREKNHV